MTCHRKIERGPGKNLKDVICSKMTRVCPRMIEFEPKTGRHNGRQDRYKQVKEPNRQHTNKSSQLTHRFPSGFLTSFVLHIASGSRTVRTKLRAVVKSCLSNGTEIKVRQNE